MQNSIARVQNFLSSCSGSWFVPASHFDPSRVNADGITEIHHSQNTALLLPTVTCFIPSLAAGEPFRISIHSWQNPEASRYIHQIDSRHAEHVMFEARVFVDGRIAGWDFIISREKLAILTNL